MKLSHGASPPTLLIGDSPQLQNTTEHMNDWELKPEDWERFLKWLNPDSDLAANGYEMIRSKLIHYFLKKGCAVTEGLADQTIDRAARLLSAFHGPLPDNPLRYCYGVANYIYKEYLRKQVKIDGGPVADEQPDRSDNSSAEEEEIIDQCLGHCLQKLDQRKQQAFLRYYLTEAQSLSEFRRKLAGELGLTLNALRLLIMRLNDELRACITTCQQREIVRKDL